MKNTLPVSTMRALAVAVVAACSATAMAQPSKADGAASYPARSIRLVVPVPPGGSSDGMARVLGVRLTEAWGQHITSSLPFIKAHRLRALAGSAKERNAQLPDVPTMV